MYVFLYGSQFHDVTGDIFVVSARSSSSRRCYCSMREVPFNLFVQRIECVLQKSVISSNDFHFLDESRARSFDYTLPF